MHLLSGAGDVERVSNFFRKVKKLFCLGMPGASIAAIMRIKLLEFESLGMKKPRNGYQSLRNSRTTL